MVVVAIYASYPSVSLKFRTEESKSQPSTTRSKCWECGRICSQVLFRKMFENNKTQGTQVEITKKQRRRHIHHSEEGSNLHTVPGVDAITIPKFQNGQLMTTVCSADGARWHMTMNSYAQVQWARMTQAQISIQNSWRSWAVWMTSLHSYSWSCVALRDLMYQ